MITTDEIRAMLLDVENDRVERTISTTNTDKFGQAICAFANDLSNHRQPGYLFLGVEDDGKISGINVTDDLLKNIAAIRTDGNIQPQPSMSVQKVSIPEGDIIVVEVQPHVFPPVRYKGRVWIRVGPRKGIASEADERILMEKRAAGIQTFDSTPCFGASIDDIDESAFKYTYLPKAIPEEVSEHKFSGNLCKILGEIDTFIKTTIANRRPIPVSAAREDYFVDYPSWATRELVMNAICHRDYTGNGPVQFYQYDDRIEILNPGGLYGKANSQNFPRVNDYRNPIIAEGMRVLGYVNRYSWGVLEVQDRLEKNGNGLPEFDLSLVTAFLVKERISPKGAEARLYAIEQGYMMAENGEKPSKMREKMRENEENPAEMRENESDTTFSEGKTDISEEKPTSRLEFPTLMIRNVYELIKLNKKIKYSQMEDNLGVDESSIWRAVAWLKENGYTNPEHSKVKGEWQLL